MIRRSSLKWPIMLGVVLLALIVALLVFWIVGQATTGQWAMLTVGTIFFTLVMIGVVLYLVLSVKEVRLTRRQANFIDSVTHELKSPIASLKLYLQTMDLRDVSQEQQREFHRFMMEDVQRLDSLIDHLLEAARLDHAHREQPMEEVALKPLLSNCIDTIVRRHEVSRDCVEMDVIPCSVTGYPHDLEMICLNLLDNAVKYAGSPPQVNVTVRVINGRVSVRISDNGRGVRYEFRRKIFQRFFRGGSELKRTTKGTGLGLYLVKSLVARMRGKIQVHGRGPLGGATFELDLPGKAIPLPPAELQKSISHDDAHSHY